MAKYSKVLRIRYGDPLPEVELPDASIPPIDEAHFVSRPADSGNTYAEEQCDAIARQQKASYAERGEQQARDATIRVKSTEAHAGHAKERLLQAGSKSKVADERAIEAHVALDRFRQRPTNAKWLYYTRFIAIIAGDVAGYPVIEDLPSFTPYLRAKYDLPDSAVSEMERFFARLAKKHGVQGPTGREDEQ